MSGTTAKRVTRSSASRATNYENVKENNRPDHPNQNHQAPTNIVSKPVEKSAKEAKEALGTSSSAKKKEEKYETIEERNQNGEVVRRYLKGKLLGRGGFAKAYWATCLATQKQYAMKVVLKTTLTKPKAKAKLQAEVKIHSALKHKYVVRFYHFFEDKDAYYLLLELAHNRSFSELMKKRKRLTEPEVQLYMQQIVEALSYMHGIGVIHRDLKLGNLLLDKNMNVKIGDLGLAARVSDVNERKRTLCGTPNYIAPEILENKHGHSFQVDIWSAGVVLYTMLVGRPPYESKDIKATYKRILANDFSFPDHIELSAASKDLVCSMLQKKPENRPSLETIAAHAFFHRKEAPIPASIPVSSLLTVPTFEVEKLEVKKSTPEMIQTQTTEVTSSKKSNSELLKPLARSLKPRPEVVSVVVEKTTPSSSTSRTTPSNEVTHTRDMEKRATTATFDKMKSDSQTVRNLDSDNRAEKTSSATRSRVTSSHDKKAVSTRLSMDTQPIQSDGMGEVLDMQASNSPDMAAKTSSSKINARSKSNERSSPHTKDEGANGDMGTLENIHRNLAETMANLESGKVKTSEMKGETPLPASQWVTQYVDYTTKYGLGYLLVDGSTGVYFNDSTKIVLGTEGSHFTYLERVRTDKTSFEKVEHHTLSTYPPSLHKKVTLLQHFRDYLLQQQKEKNEKDGEKPPPRTVWGDDENAPKVYVKKWVRTRHAILFRLSNQNIQVMFLDNTEIILSNEAKVVTFLDKQGVRKTMNLNEVVSSPRNDITKRLKYTKDILRQLITNAKR